jgi:hypothetical protein
MLVAQFRETDCQFAFILVILDSRQAMCVITAMFSNPWITVTGWKLDVHCTVNKRQKQVGWPLVHCSLALARRWCPAILSGINIGPVPVIVLCSQDLDLKEFAVYANFILTLTNKAPL